MKCEANKEGKVTVVRQAFDISRFDEYREDNRREVKRANGGLPVSLWETYSSFANCYGYLCAYGKTGTKACVY